jgi:YVTN family beta-propeller protein
MVAAMQLSGRRVRSRVVAIGAGVLFAAACSSSHRASHASTSSPSASTVVAPSPNVPVVAASPTALELHEQHMADLAHPVDDAAAAATTAGVVVAGGLDASGTSTNRMFVIAGTAVHNLATFPYAFHDAAAASIDGTMYVFGGGNGTRQLDGIWRVTNSGGASRVATLPAPSSDSSATVLDDTAYVVGGYTGQAWLDTVVAYRPGSAPRVVAHLPDGRRYAAVANDGHAVYVFGGSTASAEATDDVFRIDVTSGRVQRVGALPRPLSHLAAVAFGRWIVVAGGHGTSSGDVSDAIYTLDAVTGQIVAAGHLALARSDLGLVAVGSRLVTVGGRTANGRTGYVGVLVATSPTVDVYAHTGARDLSAATKGMLSLVYVPNSMSNTVDVIDPRTYRIVAHYAVGELPQHITPSWDLQTLYVDNDKGNSLTPIDPRTGRPRGPAIPVDDPYNLYFTPDGHDAIVVAERNNRLDFRDPHTMALRESLHVPCTGIDHMDFTADGEVALASCEFSGQLVVVDLAARRVLAVLDLPFQDARPQDVKLAPDGRVFYVADMNANGVWLVDARAFRIDGFLHTDRGAHGLYPSRDATELYVSNRDAGTISVIQFTTSRIVATWRIPGGSPDMGGVSVDGSVLWLTGRYNGEVYAISTRDGRLLARIPVGAGPHGLCVWPQPGRYSLGHTGVMR